jgi:sugar phosphate isomerase/epimerase
MKYGATNLPSLPILDEIRNFAEMGFDYLELGLDAPTGHYSVIRETKTEILNALENHSMGLVCHLPTFVFSADMTESIRKASLEETVNSIQLCAELGALKAVLHPAMTNWLGFLFMEKVKEYANEALEIIVEQAAKINVCLCIENMFPKYGYFFEPDEFLDVLERFPSLKVTLDVSHANIGDQKKNRISRFIRILGDHISHVHVSDNKGREDDHLPIGAGKINFREVIKALEIIDYKETVTFEVFTDDRTYAGESLKRFKEMINHA